MKPRGTLNAEQTASLREGLASKLDGVGVETQPEVGGRLLELVQNPDAGMAEYADLVRTDPSITGRLLRLANSALFAQRDPVTSIDRACVLLGLERLRAVSLGFSLSRAAAGDSGERLGRVVWGQSLFRACLASELARPHHLVPEAFIVGMLLDCGVPIMHRLLGEDYAQAFAQSPNPAALLRLEHERMPFSHVDVAAALSAQWKLPSLVSDPVVMHHAVPHGDASVLHRIAFVVGSVELRDSRDAEPDRLAASLHGLLGLTEEGTVDALTRAGREYRLLSEMFGGIAETITDVDSLRERVHRQFVAEVDELIRAGIVKDHPALRLNVQGRAVEIVYDEHDSPIAYLADSTGQRIIAFRFDPAAETGSSVLEALGFETPPGESAQRIDLYLHRAA